MAIDPDLFASRFGLGRAPGKPPAQTPDDLLGRLAGPDEVAARFPVPVFSDLSEEADAFGKIHREIRKTEGDAREALIARRNAMRQAGNRRTLAALRATMARAVDTDDPLRERLSLFWADHFTTIGAGAFRASLVGPYIEEAIRPNLAGRFADLLRATVLHPMMLIYLDQNSSMGPNSVRARRLGTGGLNENLARELLELHTLGVDGRYSQEDVRQVAELLAGLHGSANKGLRFFPNRGEPGPERILGRRYGRREPRLEPIEHLLDTLASHPDTARHIAHKLAAHFVADTPPPEIVERLAGVFTDTDGDLMAVYAALLSHPAAQTGPARKAKPPFDFMATTLRAMGVPGAAIVDLGPRQTRRHFATPLARMGQPWQRPNGPDGWDDTTRTWIAPQGLAARITWALDLPRLAADLGHTLPDPRDLVDLVLGQTASEIVRFAAGAAEARREGVALVLASPEFQRR